ncbi:hypothetical protein FSP39_008255 [Pinctada imbricata]|uniref:PLAT domain-containing protein n=1 Tax=Pinctada imbricata TaxID=66713 RepID=A0AA88Y2X8_PINIB|nr:hypothetical protein FSP39_008255 [Pinctada imbricata]
MGSSPSWYFSRMQIQDLQTGDKYFFLCEQWLSVDEEDGLIDRMIPIAGKAELTSFNYLFWSKTKHNLADGHLWFSIFQRPARSNFTRVQRLTCCLALLFSTMVSSIAFYNVGTGSNPQEYKLGPVSFTMQGLYIGIVSGLMCFPINLIIVCLFRYAKPRPIKKKPKVFPNKEKREDGTKEGSKSLTDLKRSKSALSLPRQKSDVNIDFVEDELEQQRDYLDTGDTKKKIMSEVPPAKQTEFPHNAQLVSFEKDGRKSRGKLPWWIIFVAYVLSLITVGVAFWASVEFGGVFGMQKSLDWLLSFFVSFFESIFFSQPIKVIVLAIFYALVIKKPEANEDEAQLPTQITNDEELLHKPLTEKDLEDPQVLKMLENLKAQAPLPPEMDFLETVRKERAKELAMFGMLKEIAICIVFINFILTIAYTNRDPWSYKMYANYDNIFNKAEFSTNYSMKFHDIKSRGHFWNWTEHALLEGLYGNTVYNGDASPETRLTQDMQAFLIGGARLRQLRIIPDLCYSPLNYFTVECMREYSMGDEQRDTYGIQWVTVNNSDPLFGAHPFFTYQDGSTLSGYPYWGIFATYSGGGYVAELGTTYDSAAEVVQFLKNNFWIDKYTRAVFIEANLYNPNMNLWGISMYLCEFLQQGAVEPFPRFHIFRLDRYVQGDFMYFVLSVEIISIAFVIFYTVKEVRKIQSQGPKYFKEFWNLYEVFTIAIAYAIILVFIYRAAISAQMMKKIKDDPNSFTNFYFAILWDDLSGWFIGILTFLLTVRFLHLLRFNKKIALLGNTLYYTAQPLLSFLFVFMLALLAFACLAYLFFNATLYDFRSYMVTIQTLLSMMLGKFDYNNAMRSKAGPFIFGFFSLCFSFVLINFFLTILIDGFESVRQDPENQTNEHEVVDYLMKKLKLMMGIGGPPKKRMPQFVQDPRLSKYVYIEGKTPDQEKIGKLDDKVDTMLQKMEGMIDKPEDEDELEKEIEKVKNRRKRKIVGSQ